MDKLCYFSRVLFIMISVGLLPACNPPPVVPAIPTSAVVLQPASIMQTAAPQPETSSLVSVAELEAGITAIAAGGNHTCELLSGGVKCWGFNRFGQLGDGTNKERRKPTDVLGLSEGVTAITIGINHTCALTSLGGVKCWGANDSGQLGDGTEIDRNSPVDVVGLNSGVTALAAGYKHTCALLELGKVRCWGENYHGQVGDGTDKWKKTPVDVFGLKEHVVSIAAGDYHTCALMVDGGVKCWGWNDYGQLGNNSITEHNTPVDVHGLPPGIQTIIAGGETSYALTAEGGIIRWGEQQQGDLPDAGLDSASPVNVADLESGVIYISASDSTTCVLMDTGKVKCWGWNKYGQLGDGTTMDRRAPVDATILPEAATAIAVGGTHTCAILTSGQVVCFGSNKYGQLGLVPTPTKTPYSTQIPGQITTPPATPLCAIQDGKWESEQSAGELNAPLITFEVRNCAITNIEIVAFPARGELDWISEEDLDIPIENNRWTYTRESGEGQLTVSGTFGEDASSFGSLKYTKNYFIVDYTLNEDVEIPWNAMPVEP